MKLGSGNLTEEWHMSKRFFAYIINNPRKTVPYTSVTNNLSHRVYEHNNKLTPGFIAQYNAVNLIYYEGN
jgi:putative endonuclease